jgi:hypothetical protein
MRRANPLRTIALLTLLLPGLVLAAPTAGACGHCDRGAPCATMAAPEPVAEAHSCCSGETVEKPAESTPAPAGAKACDCGREAPVAIAAVEAPAPENDRAATLHAAVWSDSVSRPLAAVVCQRAPSQPSHPLLFLIDCVFLT